MNRKILNSMRLAIVVLALAAGHALADTPAANEPAGEGKLAAPMKAGIIGMDDATPCHGPRSSTIRRPPGSWPT